ncbi:MAG: hypothetical protein RLZZ244_1662 [Verrucomicrobiota bacterium]|jgi:hypothetical protein
MNLRPHQQEVAGAVVRDFLGHKGLPAFAATRALKHVAGARYWESNGKPPKCGACQKRLGKGATSRDRFGQPLVTLERGEA